MIVMKPLVELAHYLRVWAGDCRREQHYAVLVEIETVSEIAAEALAGQRTLAATAHGARVADDEAATLLDRVLADGRVTRAELPLLRLARRHIARSSAADHNLSETLSP